MEASFATFQTLFCDTDQDILFILLVQSNDFLIWLEWDKCIIYVCLFAGTEPEIFFSGSDFELYNKIKKK